MVSIKNREKRHEKLTHTENKDPPTPNTHSDSDKQCFYYEEKLKLFKN